MPRMERLREILSGPMSPEYLRERIEAGWRVAAIHWEREVEATGQKSAPLEDVPFGLQVAGDCSHLEEHSSEQQILMVTMELIVQDQPLSRVAEVLNSQGYRTRQGTKWNPATVFDLLPRLIEAGPRMFTSDEWIVRRKHVMQVV